MGKLVISTNTTLDGVVEDPDGKEGAAAGNWFGRAGGGDLGEWNEMMTEEALNAGALLLGRRSDEWFGSRWPGRDGVLADRLNDMPKYVVSTTIDQPVWTGATVLRGGLTDDISNLKLTVEGEILIYASYQLCHALLELGLVDELRLTVFPVVLGTGRRLFGEGGPGSSMRLAGSRRIGDGLVVLTYQPVLDL